jgi:hypothetical protein
MPQNVIKSISEKCPKMKIEPLMITGSNWNRGHFRKKCLKIKIESV